MKEQRLQDHQDLARKLSKEKNFKIKQAIVSYQRVKYFRSDDLLAILTEKKEEYQPFYNILLPDSVYSPQKLFFHLVEEKVILKLAREAEDNDPKKQKRYPKNLILAQDFNPDEKGFYIWRVKYEDNHRKTKIYLTLFLSAIALICLFPIWPRGIKVSIFYISLVLLYIILGFSVVRIIVYLPVRISGYQLWLLPNLYGDCGFLDSFRPLISIKKSQDDWVIILLRLMGLGLLIFSVIYFVKEPQALPDIKEFGEQTFDDIYNWGVDFIDQKDIVQRAIPHLKDFETQDEQFNAENQSSRTDEIQK